MVVVGGSKVQIEVQRMRRQRPSKQADDKIDSLICAWTCHDENVEKEKVLMPYQESFKRCLFTKSLSSRPLLSFAKRIKV